MSIITFMLSENALLKKSAQHFNYLDTNGCEPVTVNNNYLDMLGHNPDNEAGVQYKLRTENRDSDPKLNSAVNQRTTEKNEMILAKFT